MSVGADMANGPGSSTCGGDHLRRHAGMAGLPVLATSGVACSSLATTGSWDVTVGALACSSLGMTGSWDAAMGALACSSLVLTGSWDVAVGDSAGLLISGYRYLFLESGGRKKVSIVLGGRNVSIESGGRESDTSLVNLGELEWAQSRSREQPTQKRRKRTSVFPVGYRRISWNRAARWAGQTGTFNSLCHDH